MSEWITNLNNTDGCPDHLIETRLEVEYTDGGKELGHGGLWCYSWNTTRTNHIVRYRAYTEQEPSKVQVGGDHYKSLSIQPWDAMEVWLTPEQFQGYLLGSAIKYLGRYNADKQGKGGMEDVKKAIHFLNKLVQAKGGE